MRARVDAREAGARELAGPRPAGGVPPMPPKFEATLRSFYKPSLEELVRMLSDAPDAAEWRAWAQLS